MSRWMEKGSDGVIRQGIVSMDECRYLIDEVCCNPDSDQCCDYPHPEYCLYCCPHRTKEDGLLAEPGIACK